MGACVRACVRASERVRDHSNQLCVIGATQNDNIGSRAVFCSNSIHQGFPAAHHLSISTRRAMNIFDQYAVSLEANIMNKKTTQEINDESSLLSYRIKFIWC